MTYAIVKHGGRQFKVTEGSEVLVNRLNVDAGSTVDLDEVLLFAGDDGVKVGTPFVDGAKVQARVVKHERDDKIIVFKMKRRKGYRRKAGHRQDLTRLLITKVSG
ncbi:MAG: 50S ribosomal protein L21 [Deltaproteobacteria bacterium]|nr:50S ribosomal protein L21 [Deltaproteobacteria bacterium]